MRLTTRLHALVAMVQPGNDVPRLLILFEEENGVWRDGQGVTIDPGTIDPRTQVIRFRRRPDGPQ